MTPPKSEMLTLTLKGVRIFFSTPKWSTTMPGLDKPPLDNDARPAGEHYDQCSQCRKYFVANTLHLMDGFSREEDDYDFLCDDCRTEIECSGK